MSQTKRELGIYERGGEPLGARGCTEPEEDYEALYLEQLRSLRDSCRAIEEVSARGICEMAEDARRRFARWDAEDEKLRTELYGRGR